MDEKFANKPKCSWVKVQYLPLRWKWNRSKSTENCSVKMPQHFLKVQYLIIVLSYVKPLQANTKHSFHKDSSITRGRIRIIMFQKENVICTGQMTCT